MNDLILASVAYASGSPHAATFLTPAERRRTDSPAQSSGPGGRCIHGRHLFGWLIRLGRRRAPAAEPHAAQPLPA